MSRIVLISVLILAIIIGGFWTQCIMPSSYLPTLAFDTEAWISAGEARCNHTRYRMLADLKAKQELIGLSGDEIKALLGPPSLSSRYSYIYKLGPAFVDEYFFHAEFHGNEVWNYETYAY